MDRDLLNADDVLSLVFIFNLSFQVTYGLKHFSDVITKRKLEMLPDNGTIVFEMIANIHKGTLNEY